MKINVRTNHVVLRMNQKTYLALHKYMHAKEGEQIRFPYGTFIAKRGFGWYRLHATTDKRMTEKLEFAITCIKRFLKEEEDKIDAELKKWAPMMVNPNMQITSYSSEQFGYLGMPQAKEPDKPAVTALHALATKFNSIRK